MDQTATNLSSSQTAQSDDDWENPLSDKNLKLIYGDNTATNVHDGTSGEAVKFDEASPEQLEMADLQKVIEMMGIQYFDPANTKHVLGLRNYRDALSNYTTGHGGKEGIDDVWNTMFRSAQDRVIMPSPPTSPAAAGELVEKLDILLKKIDLTYPQEKEETGKEIFDDDLLEFKNMVSGSWMTVEPRMKFRFFNTSGETFDAELGNIKKINANETAIKFSGTAERVRENRDWKKVFSSAERITI